MQQAYNEENGIGIFHLSGPRNESETQAAWASFAEAVAVKRLRGLLICDATASTLTISKLYYLAQVLGMRRFVAGLPVALVTPPDQPDNDNEFFVNCLFNQGFALIRFFQHEGMARAWLHKLLAAGQPPA